MNNELLPNEIEPAFKRSKTAFKSENEIWAINVASVKKKRLKREETASDELFQTSFVPNDFDQYQEIIEIMGRHSEVLSVTRPGTKVMETTFLKIEQILKGEFLFAYTWDRSWYSKVSKNCSIENLKFTWENLVSRLNDVLDYVCERQPFGYWWPTKRNGKMKKSSLSDFLASPTKAETYWSPFLEIACGDCITPKMLRSSLGDKICLELDEILKNVWFGKDFNTMVNFYRGANDLKKWFQDKREKLVSTSSQNNYNLSSFSTLLERVKQCNLETKCVGPSFIGPWSNKWVVFKNWLNKVHGVSL